MSRRSTAKRIKDLNNYSGDVGLFELSKLIKKGALSSKYVVVARFKPRSGVKNTTVWFSNEKGDIVSIDPLSEGASKDMVDALDQFGYKLI